MAISLSVSLLLGIGLPFLLYGLAGSTEIWNFFALIGNGVLLSFIFSGLAFWVALCNDNKIRGFGLAILVWLFFAVIYDGLFLLLLLYFREYPLEGISLGLSVLNPIDLSRIMVLLKLDVSALMGYTGAVFQKFFGTWMGMILSILGLSLWILVPTLRIRRIAAR
ncbi:MAG: ABC transporter permease, partial [Lewinella sp.]|nr:ABC transporter permease [Lewinella sp.]